MTNFYNILGCTLDDNQIKAIEDDHDNVLVVAGAGTGKTQTILGKIKQLIYLKNINENDILCISFTNETCNSLINKLAKLNINIEVLTFHKLGLKLLNNNNYSIINDNYLYYIIDEYFKSYIQFNKYKCMKFKNIFYTRDNTNIVFKSKQYNRFKQEIYTFINLLKSNNDNENKIYNLYKKSIFLKKIKYKIILDIYIIYKRELESINSLDFNDMINLAITNVKNTNLNYKYIIVDEFQDTSIVRCKLLQELVNKTNAKLFVVGDDYQSIYRFSGCNLKVFLNFSEYFNKTSTAYLTKTYRFSKELAYVSSNFIMKNPKQLKKNITGLFNVNKPIVINFNYSVDEILEIINDYENTLIIGRNNNDIKDIEFDNKLTIHKSKGLEDKYVILVNSDNIPSKIKNTDIINSVTNDKDYILYEEERRLFYVALTRAKEKIYIQVNKKISPFVKELIKDYKNYIQILKK